MLRGGNEILEHCKKSSASAHKAVTADGVFSLEEVECIGACCWAPAIQVNYDFHEELTPDHRPEFSTAIAGKPARKGAADGRAWSPIPTEVKVVSRRFGMGATNIDRYVELGGYESAKNASHWGPSGSSTR